MCCLGGTEQGHRVKDTHCFQEKVMTSKGSLKEQNAKNVSKDINTKYALNVVFWLN